MVRHRRHPAPQEARRRRLRPALRGGDEEAQRLGLRAGVTHSQASWLDLRDHPLACRKAAHDHRTRRSAAVRYFDAIAAALEGPRNIHARRPLAALPARHRRQDRRRIHRPAGDLLLLLAQPAGLHRRVPHLARESGFPVFQNLLELENDRQQAQTSGLATSRRRRAARRDGRLHPAPQGISDSAAEARWPSGSIWRTCKDGDIFGPFTLARTVKVSVNPKAMRPFYLVHWATFDGTANLPLIYMATRRGFLRGDGEAAGRQQRQAQREGRDPASRRRAAQPRAGAPLRRFHREELGLHAVAGDHRRQSRQGFRDAPPRSS